MIIFLLDIMISKDIFNENGIVFFLHLLKISNEEIQSNIIWALSNAVSKSSEIKKYFIKNDIFNKIK